MTALIITIVLALSISALCSTMEAMLYSIPWTTLEKMKESGSRSGKILYHMRSNVDQPISAILTLNTIANTAGASLARSGMCSTNPRRIARHCSSENRLKKRWLSSRASDGRSSGAFFSTISTQL